MMEKCEYKTLNENKDKKNIIAMQTGAVMENKFDQVLMEDVSGMKICFEFPTNTPKDERIEQEIKAILSGELRDSLQKNAG